MPDTLWDMTWDEYRRYANGYVVRQNREWERTRLLATQMVNMLKEKPISPQQYMPLATDPVNPEEAGKAGESEEEFWRRMTENNFFQRPPAPAPDAE
ncbi:hypothetical protein [Hymenobacter sp. HSC-4F20]|uniref:hypothetical protein n=1 Tax=Hymenobacter sp. HSC-4F20 TaxID=2864135 RepID=UPI001C7353F3|nr:hypothetical protein [Hymenobacter sp. HSC-4F20]